MRLEKEMIKEPTTSPWVQAQLEDELRDCDLREHTIRMSVESGVHAMQGCGRSGCGLEVCMMRWSAFSARNG